MVNNPLVAFQEAMRAAGVFLAADAHILPDGQLHRARAADDKAGALSIWYNFHPDAPASGAAGDWRTGARVTWCSKRPERLSRAEREALHRRIEADRRRAQEAQEARHRAAAERAAYIWQQSAPASRNHPYLVKKRILPGTARQRGDALILPVRDFTGAVHGLQFIGPDGSKRFLSGTTKQAHCIPTGEQPDGTRPLWIAEGWATSMTLAAMRPSVCIVAALDCGNLANVALTARKRWPALEIVICPDFDAIGRERAQEAASAARAMILPPPASVPPGASDWNDVMAAKRQGVRHG